jgi:hypothetical protein
MKLLLGPANGDILNPQKITVPSCSTSYSTISEDESDACLLFIVRYYERGAVLRFYIPITQGHFLSDTL